MRYGFTVRGVMRLHNHVANVRAQHAADLANDQLRLHDMLLLGQDLHISQWVVERIWKSLVADVGLHKLPMSFPHRQRQELIDMGRAAQKALQGWIDILNS